MRILGIEQSPRKTNSHLIHKQQYLNIKCDKVSLCFVYLEVIQRSKARVVSTINQRERHST